MVQEKSEVDTTPEKAGIFLRVASRTHAFEFPLALPPGLWPRYFPAARPLQG
jgi:hypothetical protein